jgi:hypothetical protein
MTKKAVHKRKKPKTMKEVTKGFEEFIKKHKKKSNSKAGFDKLLTKATQRTAAK